MLTAANWTFQRTAVEIVEEEGACPSNQSTILAERPTAKLDGTQQKAFISHSFVGQ